jgi:hypothetical protein
MIQSDQPYDGVRGEYEVSVIYKSTTDRIRESLEVSNILS